MVIYYGHNMDIELSKSRFKGRALEYFRHIEESGDRVIITDHGRPVLEIRKLEGRIPLEALKGTVLRYEDPTAPVAETDWLNA